MSKTHGTKGGGVRSRARLQIGTATPIYTDMWVAGDKYPGFGQRTQKQFPVDCPGTYEALHANDAERYVIQQTSEPFVAALKKMKPNDTAVLEFHGNHGPCKFCKKAISTFADGLATQMYNDTSLQLHVYYSMEPDGKVLGSEYGWTAGTTRQSYGATAYLLFKKEFDIRQGHKSRPSAD